MKENNFGRMSRREFLAAAGKLAVGAGAISAFGLPVFSTRAKGIQIAVRELKRPTFSQPEFVVPGGRAAATVSASKAGRATKARLLCSFSGEVAAETSLDSPLPEGGGNFEIDIPAHVPSGLYDLEIQFTSGGEPRMDMQRHSVSVIESFEAPLKFAHVTDYHMGDPRAEKQFPGMDIKKVRVASIEAANRENPQFILLTGDITAYPETYDEDYPAAVAELLEHARVPMVIIPGNHDFYSWLDADGTLRTDGVTYWRDFFGPTRRVLDFGPHRFICFNSYDWDSLTVRNRNLEYFQKHGGAISYSGTLSKRELSFVARAMETSGDRIPILAAHHGPRQFEPVPQQWCSDCTGMNKFMNLIKKFEPPYFFYGHIHRNEDITEGKTRYVATTSVGSDAGREELWAIRIAQAQPDMSFDIRTLKLFDSPPMKG
ncbi:MAG: cyclic 3',5'-adenosine monophosphate phosphodiesterase [bacterium ADurb.Bin236]|nr:MAG: cyclic 3',5'-adenosine monophosphate phosphodiesterase [bacterium ADurb.Bin236]HOY61942.1 metallophosphoesterase [bacterium]HPN95507.1 metallophosphoesterase [bacterium]